jgi:spermidine synthase
LRAALDALGPSAQIVVCELIPEIVTWNKGPLAVLAGQPLRDARVHVWSNSVVDVIAKGDLMFDALLLDRDNGPDCVVHGPNQILYQPAGLRQMSQVLMPNGLAGFWSAARSPDFEAVMDSESWVWSRTSVGLSSQRRAPHHTVYVA